MGETINMSLINKLATAGAVAVMGLGLGAASASAAIELSPANTPFTGAQDPNNPNVFSAGGAEVVCDSAEFTGNTGNASTTYIPFHAEYDDCSINILGFPFNAEVTTHSDWRLHYTSGDATNGVTADVDILDPGGSVTPVTISVPDIGCTINIYPQSGLSHVQASNTTPTGVYIDATVSDIAYHTSGTCPGLPGTGTDGTYVGGVVIPGITITDA
jgi:hypothetical protein